MLDYLIRNGTVVDGSGSPGVRADVGIRDGRIVAVGDIDEPAATTLDASGFVVAPGFIDPHTHYDAQLLWDPWASPSSLHGVTTVIGGNCGFTLAPLAPGDADYTRRMMAMVEGMPLTALEEGIEWDWNSWAEYLDRLDGRIGLNAGFLVGHCALRRAVMGRNATGNEADAKQVEAMATMLHDALAAGGLGFSSSQAHTHNDGDHNPVASRFAGRSELLALAAVVREHPGTTLEFITDGCLDQFSDQEIDLMVAMSLAARRPMNWNVMGVSARNPARHEHQLNAGSRAKAAGARIVALTMPMLGGLKMSFLDYCALHSMPGLKEVLGLPVSGRMAVFRDPASRQWVREKAETVTGALAALARWGRYEIGETVSPENAGLTGRTVAEIARERGQDEYETLVEILLHDGLATALWPIPSDDDDESWKLRLQVWRDERAIIGGSDAGAHLDRMCGARYPTAFLGSVVRDRGLLPLEEAIHMMTDVPARLFGLRQRGRLEAGWHADIVIFDPETIAPDRIHTRRDLPGGTERLFAGATGIHRVLVNGREIVVDGRETGVLAGTLLRSGRDTETVEIGG
jgi:N-acyl-D-aspartate/D-glutamate deacylase